MDLNDLLAVVNTEHAAALSLSKGGWEGWLQAELWYYLNITKTPTESTEREVKFPQTQTYCDLMTSTNQWVEIKAFGIFREGDENRFMDGIALDVMKMDKRPNGATGLVWVVVPRAIGDELVRAFKDRGWNGFERTNAEYVSIFQMRF